MSSPFNIVAMFCTTAPAASVDPGRSIAAALQRGLEAAGLHSSHPEWRPTNSTNKGWWIRIQVDAEEFFLILRPLDVDKSGSQRWLLSLAWARFPRFGNPLSPLYDSARVKAYRTLGSLAEIVHPTLVAEGARDIDWPREGKDSTLDRVLAGLSTPPDPRAR